MWKLRLIKPFEEGAARYHEEILGSPFKIVLLDADRTVVDSDAPAQITTPVGRRWTTRSSCAWGSTRRR